MLILPTGSKKSYRNRTGVVRGFAGKPPQKAAGTFPKPCSDTFGGWLHAFADETRTSPKVDSFVTLNFERSANGRFWKYPCPLWQYNIWVYLEIS